MKRPPGLWVLLSAGVLMLCLHDVYAVRATALIFGRSTSTTTPASEEKDVSGDPAGVEEGVTEVTISDVANVTGPTLTGNPQIDYVYDPNLPKELNGYNLSSYPFYERVPEDIDFKCDGLHDGFYASVPHKCQVYHHCLFGTRYDFLCANYTAFDQKTFICHFVSEVDCVNSKKYWHRNDALYKEASTTTTTARPINLNLYTIPPQHQAQGQAPIAEGAVAVAPPQPVYIPIPAPAPRPRRPSGGGGYYRPNRRRRPYEYDYEYDEYEDDDDYVEQPRRRKRPRHRPRPIYDDDEDDYEDDRYERRRPYRNNNRRRNKDRRKYEDDEEEDDVSNNKRRNTKRRPYAEYDDVDDDDVDDRRRSRPKNRRPVDDDEEGEGSKEKVPESVADKPITKPNTGSIYDRTRPAPRIKPPVPKTEANKYSYNKGTATTKASVLEDQEEEYEDDYEEPRIKPKKHNNRRDEDNSSRSNRNKQPQQQQREDHESVDNKKNRREERKPLITSSASRIRPQSSRDPEIQGDDEAKTTTKRPSFKDRIKASSAHRELNNNKKKQQQQQQPVEEYYEDEYIEEEPLPRYKSKSVTSTTTTTTTTTTTPRPTTTTTTPTTTTTDTSPAKDTFRERPENIVRIVKRPFLPSRGGNPYSARGLQPVGIKASDNNDPVDKEEINPEASIESKPVFKPSPVIIKVPVMRQKLQDSDFKPVSNRPQTPPRPNLKPNNEYSGPRTTQKPKIDDVVPLDLENDEYDVTLNDALNPTLPNLPVRSFPTGFGSGGADYYVPRQRYVAAAAPVDNGQDYYQNKPIRQRFEAIPYTAAASQPQSHFVSSNVEYKGYSTIQRPRVTQAYFTSY